MGKMSKLYIEIQERVTTLRELGFTIEDTKDIVSQEFSIPIAHLENMYYSIAPINVNELMKTVIQLKAQYVPPEAIVEHLVNKKQCSKDLAQTLIDNFQYIEIYHKIKQRQRVHH